MPIIPPDPPSSGCPELSNCRNPDSQFAIAIMTGVAAKYDSTCASTPTFELTTSGVVVATVVVATDVAVVVAVVVVVVVDSMITEVVVAIVVVAMIDVTSMVDVASVVVACANAIGAYTKKLIAIAIANIFF